MDKEEKKMECAERDSKAYELGMAFLLSKKDKGITKEVLERYLSGENKSRPNSIPEIFRRMLGSAKNANMVSGVIGDIEELRSVLFSFNPVEVIANYPDWKSLFNKIKLTINPRGKMRSGKRSIWPRFCRTTLSSAFFLGQFMSAADFYSWCDTFDKDIRSRLALPLLLDKEIDGYGFALSCDFLKELGYKNYGKPDVHIRDIFEGIGLCRLKTSNYNLLKTIIRIAGNVGVPPYRVDKMFWLIGSGTFYYDKETIGKKGRIGRMKAEFIRFAKSRIR
jgi:hypothetical protein